MQLGVWRICSEFVAVLSLFLTCLQLDINTTHLLLRCDLMKLHSISNFLGSCRSKTK